MTYGGGIELRFWGIRDLGKFHAIRSSHGFPWIKRERAMRERESHERER